MQNKVKSIVFVAVFLLAASTSVFAHHGNAGYNAKEVTVKGTVTQFVWSNPHSQLYFDVTDEKGNVAHWGGETNGPGTLAKDGWTKTTLKPGDQITITVFPSKAGTPYGLVSKVVLPSGKEFVPVSPETAAKRTDGQASPSY